MIRGPFPRSLALLLAVPLLLHAVPGSGQDLRSGPGSAGGAPRAPVGAPAVEPPHHPSRILVKLTPGAAQELRGKGGLGANARATGLTSLDAIHAGAGVRSIRATAERFAFPEIAAQAGVDRWQVVELAAPGQDLVELLRRYREDPNVEDATLDYEAFPALAPNDPTYPSQWGHNNTAQMLSYCWGCGGHPAGSPVGTPGFDANAEAAWGTLAGYGSSSVIIAIIDSGVDLDHPDLAANLVAGWDYGSGDSNPDDNSSSPGHGTACSGVAAARANNGIGVAGIAGHSKVMPLKVANNAGQMFFSSIQSALVHAADNGADIASMSLGAAISSDPATDNSINYAYNAGVVILAATGNGNKSVISYPAIHANVIGVGAASPCGDRKRSSSLSSEVNPGVSTDPNGYTCDGERWWGSSYGVNTPNAGGAVDVIAPTILPTTDIAGAGGYSSGDYDLWFNGTSCATPYAAGVCALILTVNPTWTPAQVRAQLVNTAIDIVNVESGAGWDRYAGYGMVDAAAAVGGGGGPTPPAAPSGLSATAVSSSQINLAWTDNATDETGYHVERSTDGTNFSEIAALGANATSYSNTGLAASTTYWYRVRASNTAGFSGYSNTANATTQAAGGTWVTITYDDFEAGLGSYTDGGSDMSRYTGGTYAWQGVAAADIQDNSGVASSFYTTTARNVTSYSNMEVQFYFRAQSMETGEDFWLQYFNGSTWQTVATFVAGTSFSNGAFYTATVPIPRTTYTYPTGARIRFMCDASDNNDDVYVDAITWRGFTGSAQSALLAGTEGAGEPLVQLVGEAAPLQALAVEGLEFRLGQNNPNPFRGETTIEFALSADEPHVSIAVYDVAGRQVATLADGPFRAGPHTVRWNARGVATGLYFYRIVAGENVATRRLLVR